MGTTNSGRVLAALVDDHYTGLYRYAYRLCGTSSDAEDLTQEAFCKAHAQLAQLRDVSRAKPWLYSILRNAYLQRLRAEKTHRQVSLDAVGDLPAAEVTGFPEFTPEQVQTALMELPEGFRTPVILFYFEEMSYRDIAEQMDLPIGTVMSRLARAKAHLKDRLRPGGGKATDGL